jgi:hypothetical protein
MKNKVVGVLLLGFICVIVYKVVEKINRISNLKENIILKTASVDSFWVQFKSSSCYVNYSFNYKGIFYSQERDLYGINCNQSGNYFIKRTFPIAIDTTNPQNSLILITPNHFKKIGLAYPDSLKWVLKYYDDKFVSF